MPYGSTSERSNINRASDVERSALDEEILALRHSQWGNLDGCICIGSVMKHSTKQRITVE
jgi:hypothetical protein